jgi:hypothetical protein
MSNDHTADECKRFAGEREAFMEQYPASKSLGWSGSEFIPSRNSYWQLQTCAQVNLLWECWQKARAAQPAPVVPEGCIPIPTVEQLAEALSNVGGFHEMSAELIAPDLLAKLLAAAPAQGQQVECRECERLRGELEVRIAQRDAAQTSIGGLQVIIEDQEAELSALKAQQVGQEPTVKDCLTVQPVAYAVFAENGNIRIWCSDPIQAETLRQQYGDDLRPLYTAPQPAPAQDVAGLRAALVEAAGALDRSEFFEQAEKARAAANTGEIA